MVYDPTSPLPPHPFSFFLPFGEVFIYQRRGYAREDPMTRRFRENCFPRLFQTGFRVILMKLASFLKFYAQKLSIELKLGRTRNVRVSFYLFRN